MALLKFLLLFSFGAATLASPVILREAVSDLGEARDPYSVPIERDPSKRGAEVKYEDVVPIERDPSKRGAELSFKDVVPIERDPSKREAELAAKEAIPIERDPSKRGINTETVEVPIERDPSK